MTEGNDAWLHPFFIEEVVPRLDLQSGAVQRPFEFNIRKLSQVHQVFLVEERSTNTKFVAKSFANRHPTRDESFANMKREYDNLLFIRSKGFDKGKLSVVKPFGMNESALVLIEEFCDGKDLSSFICDAVRTNNHQELYYKLSTLAKFLANLHRKTETIRRVDFGLFANMMRQRLEFIQSQGLLSDEEKKKFLDHIEKWCGVTQMWENREVLVHGDATPTNFLFNDGSVKAIDLERMRFADKVYDLGMVAAELKHNFMHTCGNKYIAEQFITHFYREYCKEFHDRHEVFKELTLRNAFYMAAAELRISKNTWLNWDHRRWLIKEALDCLESLPKKPFLGI